MGISCGNVFLGGSCGFHRVDTQLVWSPIGTHMNSCPIFFHASSYVASHGVRVRFYGSPRDFWGIGPLGVLSGFYRSGTQIVCDSIGTRMNSCPIFFMPVPMWHHTACAILWDPHRLPKNSREAAPRREAATGPMGPQQGIFFGGTSCCRQSAGPERPGQCRNIPLARC